MEINDYDRGPAGPSFKYQSIPSLLVLARGGYKDWTGHDSLCNCALSNNGGALPCQDDHVLLYCAFSRKCTDIYLVHTKYKKKKNFPLRAP